MALKYLLPMLTLKEGSKSVPVILRNMTATDITIHKGEKIVSADCKQDSPTENLHPGTLEALDKEQEIERKPLSRAERTS